LGTRLSETAIAQEPARPQFRAGVTVTRLEVTVLDTRTRKPVTGLTAGDFVVKVDGRRQPVVSAAEVVVPAATADAVSVLAEASDDVSTNALRPSRLFVLILSASHRVRIALGHRCLPKPGMGSPGDRVRGPVRPRARVHVQRSRASSPDTGPSRRFARSTGA
jgi:hypothetical protein